MMTFCITFKSAAKALGRYIHHRSSIQMLLPVREFSYFMVRLLLTLTTPLKSTTSRTRHSVASTQEGPTRKTGQVKLSLTKQVVFCHVVQGYRGTNFYLHNKNSNKAQGPKHKENLITGGRINTTQKIATKDGGPTQGHETRHLGTNTLGITALDSTVLQYSTW